MTLYRHQHFALQRAKQDNIALFHDCGVGKTRTAIEIIKHYGGKALVVCPLSIIDAAWLSDIQKFAPELKAVSLRTAKKEDRIERLNEDADVYIINYESFKIMYNEIVKKNFNVLIVDESSRIKDNKSQTTLAILSLAGIKSRGAAKLGFICKHPIPHRYVLSGTPAPNCELEYWPQIKLITGPGGRIFSDNFYSFRGAWFRNAFENRPVKFKKFYLPKESRQAFMDKMSPVCDVVSKADAVDLPDQIHERRIIELSLLEQKSYNIFKKELILQFGNTVILGSNALTEIMKLRQLTSGFAYTDEGVVQTGKSKLKELKALIEEIGPSKQIIIWANFRHEIAEIQKLLPDSDALWSGTANRDSVIQRFQNRQYRYLIANPQSAGHGLTFVNCSDVIYFSLNYSYELLKQSQDRVHRIGQKNKVTYYYLLAKETIDTVIYDALDKKKNLSEGVLAYLKGFDIGQGSRQVAAVGT